MIKRIAILHNYLDNIGGAEIVALTLAKELNADIYTTNIDKENIEKMGFSLNNIYSIGKVPNNAPFKHQMTYNLFKRLSLKKKYDFYIIDGDWAMVSAKKHKPNLWYCYSPIREIWDMYYSTRKKVPHLLKPIFDLWVKHHRKNNYENIQHVNNIIAISKNVKKRIKKYLNRDSIIIYPPTQTNGYHYGKSGDFWLSITRLISHKRADIQVNAFKLLPKENLILVGSYEQSRHFKEYANYIKKIKPSNVKLISWADDKTIKKLYSECKGFITTARDEDFGMTPVEAMASGKMVIAPNEGGYKETIINKKTGSLINDITSQKLANTIKIINAELKKDPNKYKVACQKQAKNFDTKIFIKKIKKFINKYEKT
jgi:glycosyltransferase involved in cell wall biosynthesis